MSSMIDVLHQEHFWGRDDEMTPILEMSTKHIKNVLNWLWRNRESLKMSAEADMAFGMQPTGEAASDAFESAFDQLLNEGANTWVRELPVARAMANVLKERDQAEAAAFWLLEPTS